MEIVQALSRALTQRIGNDSFNLWFHGGQSLRVKQGRLFVMASSPFKLDRIRAHYRAALEQACSEVLHNVPKLEFQVSGELATVAASTVAKSGQLCAAAGQATEDQPCEAASDRRTRRARRRFANLRTFVVGEGNRLALTSCEMVVNRPGEISPLFIHGPCGVGKSHLLEGIWSELRRRRGLRVVYLTAEQFTSYFLEALKGSGLPSFRRKYRGADALILDDVHFLIGKRATITELQNTVDAMLRDGRQLVLAGDRPPGQLPELGAALTARFSSGMVCAMQPSDAATRLAIARQMCTARRLEIPSGVLQYLADEFPGDARQISGALHRLEATELALQRTIDLSLAKEALADLVRAGRRAVQLDDIEHAVCDVLGLEGKKLQAPNKSKAVSHPRMLAMWLARKHTRAALSHIGQHFGRRSHTTVVSAQKKVDRWLAEHSTMHLNGRSWNVEETIREIEQRLRVG